MSLALNVTFKCSVTGYSGSRLNAEQVEDVRLKRREFGQLVETDRRLAFPRAAGILAARGVTRFLVG